MFTYIHEICTYGKNYMCVHNHMFESVYTHVCMSYICIEYTRGDIYQFNDYSKKCIISINF